MKKFKKLLSIALAAIMTMAMGVTAFAAEADTSTTTQVVNVTFNKEDSSTLSMANNAIDTTRNTTLTYSYKADGSVENVRLDIPLVPLYNYTAMNVFTADGYLTKVTVNGEEINVTANTPNSLGTPYGSATLSIVMDSLPADGVISVTASYIELYKVGTNEGYWMSHVTPAFDIVVSNAQ